MTIYSLGRPEDAAALIVIRERILFSQFVQEIFAAQNELGYWHNPEWVTLPVLGIVTKT